MVAQLVIGGLVVSESEQQDLGRLARVLGDGELRSARHWGGAVYDWASARSASVRDACEAFPAIAAAELGRREALARAAGELYDGRWWSHAFDVSVREAVA